MGKQLNRNYMDILIVWNIRTTNNGYIFLLTLLSTKVISIIFNLKMIYVKVQFKNQSLVYVLHCFDCSELYVDAIKSIRGFL